MGVRMNKSLLILTGIAACLGLAGCQTPAASNEVKPPATSTERPPEQVMTVRLNGLETLTPEQKERLIRTFRQTEHLPDNVPVRLQIEEDHPNIAIPPWADAKAAVLAKFKMAESDIPYAAKALRYVPPTYPLKLRQENREAECDFVFEVSANGKVGAIYLVAASDIDAAQCAAPALKQWTFPVTNSARLMRIKIRFSEGMKIDWSPPTPRTPG
jgi:hypothetical protein